MTYSFILPLRQYRSSPRVKYLALHIQPSSYYNMRQSPSGELSRGVFRVPACPYRQRTPGDFPMERAGVGGSSTIQEPPVQSRGNTVSGLVKSLVFIACTKFRQVLFVFSPASCNGYIPDTVINREQSID